MTPAAAAARVVQHALSRPPRLGRARLICLDGPSGSGKTTIAAAIQAQLPAQVVHVDELFPGWDGAPEIPRYVHRLLRPMAAGGLGWWRRWDWPGDRWAGWHAVRPGGVVVLEGVGSGCRAWAPWISTLVWVHAPRDLRLRRGLERNDGMDEHWRHFQAVEDRMFVRERTRERADLQIASTA